jgi:hypothetical protein
MKILFLHGWQSVPGGVKPTFLAQHGHEVINPKLPDEDFSQAVRIAQAEFDKQQPAVVVGSSRGGAVAMSINSGDARLVLLCPAWKKWGTARTVKPGTVILHSRERARERLVTLDALLQPGRVCVKCPLLHTEERNDVLVCGYTGRNNQGRVARKLPAL